MWGSENEAPDVRPSDNDLGSPSAGIATHPNMPYPWDQQQQQQHQQQQHNVRQLSDPVKAGLVWSPAPDSAHVSKPSPSSGGGAGSPPTPTATPGSHAHQHGPPLMHWMSVMAEHMSTNTHHPDVPHYMWNGVESKMNVPDQINGGSLQKDDGRMDSHAHGGHASLGGSGSLYGPRSSSSGSSTPTTAATTPSGMSGNKMGASSQSNGTGRKYQCKMCPQMFGSKADLQLHTQMHMREAKPYKCTQCTKAFANSSYLSQHTRIHLGIKPYRCEICQRKFTQLSHLQQHIRTHTGDKPYKCRHPGCNKAFSQLSNLQSHSRCHQTDKPYKCNSCYKCFTDESALLEHIPKHKESKHLKTHICQYCGKSYTQETYLAKHMQKHAERAEKRSSAAAAAAAAAALRIDTSYWSKNADGAGSGNLDHMHSHVQEPGCNLAGLDDLPRHGHHNHGHLGAQVGYDVTKTGSVSAFTPLQGGMLPLATGQLGMASAGSSSSRSYFPYDPLGFSKGHHPQMGVSMTTMEMKSANTFPNQLISLHPIKNYAHHTNLGIGATCGDPFGLAKDKNQ